MGPPQEFALDFRVPPESADRRMTSFCPVCRPGCQGGRALNVTAYAVDFRIVQISKIQDSGEIS